MRTDHDYHLNVKEVARHFGLSERTIRAALRAQALTGVQVAGHWRCSWNDIWRAQGPRLPSIATREERRRPLLSKAELASKFGVSGRTIDRWMERGLPGIVTLGQRRYIPVECEAWIRQFCGPGFGTVALKRPTLDSRRIRNTSH